MNYHLIPNDKFTDKFLWMMSDKAFIDSNLIYVYEMPGVTPFCSCDYPNVKYIRYTDLANISLENLENGNDKFFIHALSDHVVPFLYNNRNSTWMNRLVIIFYGADIYNNHFLITSRDKRLHLKVRIREYMKKCILRKCKIFMTFASPDYDYACDLFKCEGTQFDCLYPSNVDLDYLNSIISTKPTTEEEATRVLVGNSATQTNQHIDALKKLSVFSDRIQIICPLSYGDFQYREKVIECGKELFGDSFYAVTEYMSPEKYSDLLNSVDVAVFNNNRQQATANIEILAYLGKKIYIRSDTTLWGHYVIRDNCSFYDANSIDSLSYDAFVQNDKNDLEKNRKYIKRVWDIEYVKSLWENVIAFEVQ